MEYLATAQNMQNIDYKTINEIGIPGTVLMERAAIGIAGIIMEYFDHKSAGLVVVESGNNGGDGLAVARLLLEAGYDIDVYHIGAIGRETEDFKLNRRILVSMDREIKTELPNKTYDFIVDGIFGVGLKREISGKHKEVIEKLNNMSATRFAIDVPSGVNASDGHIMGTAYRADVTVTFGMNKAGLVLYPGREYAGQVRVCQIGFSNKVTEEEEYSYFTYNRQDLSRIPARKANTHKGSYGKLSVIAGSRYMSGAACLAAEAAYRTGCGMVKVYTHEANRTIVGTKIPEALMMTYSSSLDVDDIIRDAMEFGDVVLIGPGLGTDETAVALVKKLLCSSNIPVIIDADGLNILAKDMNMLSGHKADVVLTPHVKEMSVLTGHSIDEIKADLPNQARLLAEKYNITCVLKDAATCVSSGGFPVYINTSGNNGMATAGSGDVLAGIISGLIAMKADVPEAARLGVYIHGLAGDYACHTKSAYSMLAGDIIDNINKVFGGGK